MKAWLGVFLSVCYRIRCSSTFAVSSLLCSSAGRVFLSGDAYDVETSVLNSVATRIRVL